MASAHSWMDVEPQNSDCFRIIYRYERDEGQVSGWCELTDENDNPLGAGSGRPYHRDIVSADSAWVGSNTTSFCNDDMAAMAGWAVVNCYGTDHYGSALPTKRVLFVWYPTAHLAAESGQELHGSTHGYFAAWDTLPDSTRATGAALRAYLPRLRKMNGFRLNSTCIQTDVRYPSRHNLSLPESYCPVRGHSGYPHHSVSHSPYTRGMGTVLYFPPVEASSSWHAPDYGDKAAEDALQRSNRKPTVANRLRKVRRLVSYFKTRW